MCTACGLLLYRRAQREADHGRREAGREEQWNLGRCAVGEGFDNVRFQGQCDKAGDEGKLFGSLGNRDVADLASAAGVELAKSEVLLPEGPVRQVGEYDITIRLHPEVEAVLKLHVVAE